jgi:CheY-like chemotaxis protein
LGLGLAICKGLVGLHGGSIAAASRGETQGARFAVQLETLAPSSAAEPEYERTVEVAPRPGRTDATGSRQRPRILLVDDHADSLETMTELMVEMGYDVETAGSVGSALAIDFERVDLIVSDIGLPDGTGLDLIRELQAKGRRRPAIAISGFGMESDITASREAGFDLHLTKPVDYEVLSGALQRLNAERRQLADK